MSPYQRHLRLIIHALVLTLALLLTGCMQGSTRNSLGGGPLWERVTDGLALSGYDQPRVADEIKRIGDKQSYLNLLQHHAEPYLYYVVTEVERRGLPMELALLPVVESMYRPFAYSHGRAAGLWQFIPATGKRYGLKQNWWYDGRRDVVASTRAALDLLESLNRRFDGDWELALAAYNAGPGNISRAMRKNIQKGKDTDFWSLKLTNETSRYLPRLLAIATILKERRQYGLRLDSIRNRPVFTAVDVGSQIDLAMAAEMAGIPLDDLYRLNPGFNRWATAPEGPHRLLVPVEKAVEFKDKLAQLDPNDRMQWRRYRIKSGDSLGTIAAKSGTTIKLIKQINKIRGNTIRAGKHLLLPVASKQPEQYALSAAQRRSKIQNRKRSGTRVTHIVRSGDTLWGLAQQYNVHHRSLAKWNGMAPRDTLSLGQELVIWTQEKSQKHPPSTLNIDTRPPDSRSTLRYRVRRGDSLALIAQRFKVRVADLKRWNSLPGKYLQPGQHLKLYVDVTEQTL